MDRVYFRGSRGEIYDMDHLHGGPTAISSGGVHAYAWEPAVLSRRFGDRLRSMDKKAVTYELAFSVRGDRQSRREKINEMIAVFDRDAATETPSRIFFNDSYIEGYVTKLSIKNGVRPYWYECAIDFYCPYPFWITEQTRSFLPDDGSHPDGAFLDYPHPYPYDFTSPVTGVQHWHIQHYRDSNFRLIIYGTAVNPSIQIDTYRYAIEDKLASGEYIVIDSREKTVIKYRVDGVEENIFWKQNVYESVFKPIPSGDIMITWDGSFGFDITLFSERSVPPYATD